MNERALLPTPTDSLVALLKRLVRVPSQTAMDDYQPIIDLLQDWMRAHDLDVEVLSDRQGSAISMVSTLGDFSADEHYLLVAPLDTAPIGQRGSWAVPPTAAVVRQGWLYGRGSADCKAAISIFAHLLAALKKQGLPGPNQALHLVLDGEEHSGTFVGFKRALSHYLVNQKIAGAYIGYPGLDEVVAGARGYYRLTVRWVGEAAHSGSTSSAGHNALHPASLLVRRLARTAPPSPQQDEDFPLSPRQTVTRVSGGHSFSVVPERAEVDIDFRLTPSFGANHARRWLKEVIEELRQEEVREHQFAVELEEHEQEAPYQLPEDEEIVTTLQSAAERVLGRRPTQAVAGPSNVGNYLASLDIPATCGFGVEYKNLHAPNECVRLDTLGPVYQTYGQALRQLLER